MQRNEPFIRGDFREIFPVHMADAINIEVFEILERTGVEQHHDQHHFRQAKLPFAMALATIAYQFVTFPLLINFGKIVKATKQRRDYLYSWDFLNACCG